MTEEKTEIKTEEMTEETKNKKESTPKKAKVNDNLSSFLEEEIKKSNREGKSTLYIGGGLALFLVIYMSYILTMVKDTFLDPEALSDVAATYTNESVSDYLVGSETALTEHSVDVAKQTIQEVEQLIPVVSIQVQDELNHSIGLLVNLDRELSATTQAYLEQNKKTIKEFFESHNDAEFANYLVDATVERLVSNLNSNEKAFDSGRGSQEFKSESLRLITNLQKDLSKLASLDSNRLTDLEKDQLKLIAAVYNLSQKSL